MASSLSEDRSSARSCEIISDRIGTTILSFPIAKNHPGGHIFLVATVFCTKYNVSHPADNFIIRSCGPPEPTISSVFSPGASSSIRKRGLTSFLLRVPMAAPASPWFALASFCLSASSPSLSCQQPHRRTCNQFADIGEQTLAIVVTSVGSER